MLLKNKTIICTLIILVILSFFVICGSYKGIIDLKMNNLLLPIFSIFIPLSVGTLLNWIIKQEQIYTNALSAYSRNIKWIKRFLLWSIVIFFLIFVVDTGAISRILNDINIWNYIPEWGIFDKNFILSILICFEFIISVIPLVCLLEVKDEELLDEIFAGLKAESDQKKLKKYFQKLCKKDGNKDITHELRKLAYNRRDDLFLMTKEDIKEVWRGSQNEGVQNNLKKSTKEEEYLRKEFIKKIDYSGLNTFMEFLSHIQVNANSRADFNLIVLHLLGSVIEDYIKKDCIENKEPRQAWLKTLAQCLYIPLDCKALSVTERNNILDNITNTLFSIDSRLNMREAPRVFYKYIEDQWGFAIFFPEYIKYLGKSDGFFQLEQKDQQTLLSMLLRKAKEVRCSELEFSGVAEKIQENLLSRPKSTIATYNYYYSQILQYPYTEISFKLLCSFYTDSLEKLFNLVKTEGLEEKDLEEQKGAVLGIGVRLYDFFETNFKVVNIWDFACLEEFLSNLYKFLSIKIKDNALSESQKWIIIKFIEVIFIRSNKITNLFQSNNTDNGFAKIIRDNTYNLLQDCYNYKLLSSVHDGAKTYTPIEDFYLLTLRGLLEAPQAIKYTTLIPEYCKKIICIQEQEIATTCVEDFFKELQKRIYYNNDTALANSFY